MSPSRPFERHRWSTTPAVSIRARLLACHRRHSCSASSATSAGRPHLSCSFKHRCSPLAFIAVAQAPLLVDWSITPTASVRIAHHLHPHQLSLSMIALPYCPASFFERHHSSATLAIPVRAHSLATFSPRSGSSSVATRRSPGPSPCPFERSRSQPSSKSAINLPCSSPPRPLERHHHDL